MKFEDIYSDMNLQELEKKLHDITFQLGVSFTDIVAELYEGNGTGLLGVLADQLKEEAKSQWVDLRNVFITIVIVILISAILAIAAFFLQIMAVNNMVANDSLKKAFDLREITDNISNLGWGKYIGIIIFTLIVFMVVNVAAGFILSFITAVFALAIHQVMIVSVIAGILEGLFISSYTSVFYNRVCGLIYREAIK